jgi:SNF2 family DNA or RNA helicase
MGIPAWNCRVAIHHLVVLLGRGTSMIFKPHDYQQVAIDFALERPGCLWWIDPGLGKTVSSLEVFNQSEASTCLVVAPALVCSLVWPEEIQKWYPGMTFIHIKGTVKKRLELLKIKADVHIISVDLVPWLYSLRKRKQWEEDPWWDMLIVDESTKFANPTSRRFLALKKMVKGFRRRLPFTGSPVADGVNKAWSQVYIADFGERLGHTVTKYREQFCHLGGYRGYEWIPNHDAPEKIVERISDITLSLDARDHLDMPRLVINDIVIELPPKVKKAYKRLEQELFWHLEEKDFDLDEVKLADSGPYILCKQVANGGYYDEDRNSVHVHDVKMKALQNLIDELNGKPLLVFYQYAHDVERLRSIKGVKFFKDDPTCYLKDWNAGKIQVLACNPQSVGHGINMQKGPCEDVAFLGLALDSTDIYQQALKRVWRQGVQTDRVRVHRLLAKGTVDIASRRKVDQKADKQTSMLEILKAHLK